MNYFISDLHLNHQNIIKYCDRPFSSVGEMNRTIVENWNRIVEEEDTVFFLGDLAFGNPIKWLRMLNGHIVFIRGSHDSVGIHHLTLNVGFDKFLLIHNPDEANGHNGWIVHGHKHNTVPFIDRKRKRINVSVEVINYTPISLNEIREKINEYASVSRSTSEDY